MSSRNQPGGKAAPSRRRVLALLGGSMLAGPVLAGCQPLYGPTASGAQLKDVMASVEVATIPTRVGQRLRNELIFATTRGGYAQEPKYKLVIIVRQSVADMLVEQSGEAQGKMYRLDAHFKLIDLSTKKVVLVGKSSGRAAFDRFKQIFTNVRAQVDAENRAATTVAEGIRTRVAAFLSGTA